ncbi:Olfactory receptor 2W3 [Heterocephalus glaber]|uniref:Olfactory receptor 2W3 n=1 Tax=Heterocephalus glaber TaxID=10181 RepID=G5ARG1_HETGA|nr:Olfactory receptor 2W3 [Heterocephalus glaber]
MLEERIIAEQEKEMIFEEQNGESLSSALTRYNLILEHNLNPTYDIYTQGALAMFGTNDSSHGPFTLLGFSEHPHLERILFEIILVAYLLTLLGNTTIILVSWLDPHLHMPMYYFLTHLSFLDLSFTTSSIPRLLYNLGGPDKTISFAGCALKLFLFLGLGGMECLLLAVMQYDCFVAVCKPLHYMVIMSPSLCLQLMLVA